MLSIFSLILLATGGPEIVARKERAPCRQAADTNPDIYHDAMLRFGRAMGSLESNDSAKLTEASANLVRLSRDYPWFAPAFRGAAELDTRRGATLAAYSGFKRYLLFKLATEERDDVEKRLRQLEAKNPTLAAYLEAETLALAERWNEALAALAPALERTPDFALGHRLRATAHAALGKTSLARNSYAEYLRLDIIAVDRDEVKSIIAACDRALVPPKP